MEASHGSKDSDDNPESIPLHPLDSSDNEDESTPEEELISVVKSRDSEEEKVAELERLFKREPRPDVNFRGENGDTPLHIAVRRKELKVVESLVEFNADVDVRNDENRTPLDVANRLGIPANILEKKDLSIERQPKLVEARENETNQGNRNTCLESRDNRQRHPVRGFMFRLETLMLFLFRGVCGKYSFCVGTEIGEDKNFDDLVFEKTKGYGQKEYRFLQVKHRKKYFKPINKDDLLAERDSDFSLIKYFFLYRDLKKEKLFEGGSIKDVIVCTNVNLDMKRLKSAGFTVEEMEGADDILDVKSVEKQPKRYRFNEDIVSQLRPKLLNYNVTRLARRLVGCLLENDDIQCENEDDIFYHYHFILAKEVIDVVNRKFFDKFIRNECISEFTERFKKAFGKEIQKQSKGKLTLEEINEAIANNREIIGGKRVGLNLSSEFGAGDPEAETDVIGVDEVRDFLSRLVFAVNRPNQEELGEVLKREIGRAFDFDFVKTENVYNKFFVTVLNRLQGKGGSLAYEEVKGLFEEEERGTPIWFGVREPILYFTGRVEQLEEIHRALRGSKDGAKSPRTACVTGLGGVGKTELVTKYVSDRTKEYGDKIVWINAESRQSIAESFLRLASDRLGIRTRNEDGNEKDVKRVVEEVYRFFSQGKSLFIFDDAEKRSEIEGGDGISEFLPSGVGKPYVLITSRNRKWENMEVLSLETFTEAESMEFVEKCLNRKRKEQKKDINKLGETLQHLPLALQQAVEYIRVKDEAFRNVGSKFKISDYLERYEEKTKELLDFKFPEYSDNSYTKTTFITWDVTIKTIEERKYGREALKILNTIAYFANNYIPTEIFLSLVDSNKKNLRSAISLLKQYSMVNSGQEGTLLNIHRLVQQVIRINLKEKNREEETLAKALELFQDRFIQWVSNPCGENLCLNVVDHAVSVWRYACKYEELVRKFNMLPVLIVEELKSTSRYKEAHSFGSSALKSLQQIVIDNNNSVVYMMVSLMSVMHKARKRDALEMHNNFEKKVCTNDIYQNPESICRYMTSKIWAEMSKHGEALETIERIEVFPVFSKELIGGELLLEQGKCSEALRVLEIALKMEEEASQPDPESISNTKYIIAEVLAREGRYEAALKIMREVYEKRREILPANHPYTLTSYSGVAVLLLHKMEYDEALRIAIEVDAGREKSFPDHPCTLEGKQLIGEILDLKGDYEGALVKFKEVHEKKKVVLGERDAGTLDVLERTALVLARLRKYGGALGTLDEVLEVKKEEFSLDGRETLNTKRNIGKVTSAFKQYLARLEKLGNDLNGRFHRAALDGDSEEVDALLKEGADIDAQVKGGGFTALLLALEGRHVRTAEELIARGADINAKCTNGVTALHIAAYYGCKKLIEILLSKGADVIAKDEGGKMPLGVVNNRIGIVEKLLGKGADINARDKTGATALHIAAYKGHSKIVEILLNKGADVNCCDNASLSPLHVAVREGHLKIAEMLLKKGAYVEATNFESPDLARNGLIKKVLLSSKQLLDAIRQKRNLSYIERLIEDGAVINFVSDATRLTALHYAVSYGDLAVVKALLEKRTFNVNVADEDGWTPLHYAAQDGSLDIVELLLHEGADPAVSNSDGKTPLVLASERLSHDSKIYQKIIAALLSVSVKGLSLHFVGMKF